MTHGPYRYTFHDRPYLVCMECGHDLTAEGGISLVLSVDDREVTTDTKLTLDGTLVDTPDRGVAAGFHSATECGGCGEMLINTEDVAEWYNGKSSLRDRPTEVRGIEDVLDLAEAHGQDSDPDHEVGDLQDVCRRLWQYIPPETRERVVLPELRRYVRETMGYEVPG
jgi:hypothetical protein